MSVGQSDVTQRRVPRREYRRTIGLLSQGIYSLVQSHEIGERGMMISSPKAHNVGVRVVISFYLPEAQEAVVQGIIRSCMDDGKDGRPFAYGIEFEKVDFEIKRIIRTYVATTQRQKK